MTGKKLLFIFFSSLLAFSVIAHSEPPVNQTPSNSSSESNSTPSSNALGFDEREIKWMQIALRYSQFDYSSILDKMSHTRGKKPNYLIDAEILKKKLLDLPWKNLKDHPQKIPNEEGLSYLAIYWSQITRTNSEKWLMRWFLEKYFDESILNDIFLPKLDTSELSRMITTLKSCVDRTNNHPAWVAIDQPHKFFTIFMLTDGQTYSIEIEDVLLSARTLNLMSAADFFSGHYSELPREDLQKSYSETLTVINEILGPRINREVLEKKFLTCRDLLASARN